MSLIAGLFSKREGKSVALIDISTSSIGGAYAHTPDGGPLTLVYTCRQPIEMHAGEAPDGAMLRALQELGNMLIREGAPILARTTGSGSADSIIVATDSPWQMTSVRTEHFEQERAFTFTRGLVAAKLKATSAPKEGMVLVDESIIGSILNGYETRNPYGKEARRAAVVVLTSFIDAKVAESILAVLRGIFHTKRIEPIAGSSLRSQAIQMAFPHERDVLILDATGPFTSVALVRKGLIVSIAEVTVSSTDTAEAWLEGVGSELAELARHYPLPRTIFLLARETEAAALRDTLDSANLGKLWLSDNPPRIVSVLASHIAPLVRQTMPVGADLPILLMAVFCQSGVRAEKL